MFCSISTYRLFTAGLVLSCFLSIHGTAAGSKVRLAWDTNPEVRVAGYRVYRTEIGKSQILLNKDALLPEPSYIDTNVTKGGSYRYAVTAVDTAGEESSFSSEIDVKVEARRVDSTTYIPARLATDQALSSLVVGASLVNTRPQSTSVRLYSLDGSGVANGLDKEVALGPLGGFRSLMPELLPSQMAGMTLVASGEKGAFEPVFTLVDQSLKRFDGLTGTGTCSRELYFPIARQLSGATLYTIVLLDTTFVTLSNPDDERKAQVKLELVDPDGRVTRTSEIEIGPRSSRADNLQKLFQSRSIRDGYIRVTSDVPIQGFETVGFAQQSVASLWALTGERSRGWTLPYFFTGAGAETQVRLINLEAFEVSARLTFRLDRDGARLKHDLKIPAKGILIENLGALLGLPREQSHTGQLEVVTTASNGQEEIYGRVAAVACYNANSQKARAGVELQPRAARAYILPALLQSAEEGYFTALSLTNPGASSNRVEMQAFDDQGNLLGEHSLVLTPGGRAVDLLDGSQFFGSKFRQTKGQLRIRSTAPLFASALVGSRNFDFLWGAGLIETDEELE